MAKYASVLFATLPVPTSASRDGNLSDCVMMIMLIVMMVLQKIDEIQYLLKDTKQNLFLQIQKRYGTVVLYHCDNITCRLADSSLPDLGRDLFKRNVST